MSTCGHLPRALEYPNLAAELRMGGGRCGYCGFCKQEAGHSSGWSQSAKSSRSALHQAATGERAQPHVRRLCTPRRPCILSTGRGGGTQSLAFVCCLSTGLWSAGQTCALHTSSVARCKAFYCCSRAWLPDHRLQVDHLVRPGLQASQCVPHFWRRPRVSSTSLPPPSRGPVSPHLRQRC